MNIEKNRHLIILDALTKASSPVTAEQLADLSRSSIRTIKNDINYLKDRPLRSIMYYGGGTLHGIAIEGALKLMETPKIYLAAGFEAEDGIHGPCYAFRRGDAIIFLDDGGQDKWFAESMVRFSKNELGVGYMFGPEPVDDKDLVIKPVSKCFREIEYAPAVQVIAYEMAIINDVEVLEMSKRIPHVSTKYIQTHRG